MKKHEVQQLLNTLIPKKFEHLDLDEAGKLADEDVYLTFRTTNGWTYFILAYDRDELMFGYVEGYSGEYGIIPIGLLSQKEWIDTSPDIMPLKYKAAMYGISVV